MKQETKGLKKHISLKVYSAPKLEVLGKVDELTMGEDPVPGGTDCTWPGSNPPPGGCVS